ncbi:Maf1 regulator-domain-containing protein [Syncephalastrum racemosum]|uniref:Repressor of RNA polymerase III transcription MAF1 n=1 Tax=Syncephalastrum racemosum TaxID=13706 RepID=A0A1X2HNP2_SYNRA|nr:Maf1 regulator-domain-containing protein [Syncephalastrum racemosum]
MKFLEIPSLETLNTNFRWETEDCVLTGRVEAYSCKSAGSDKKLFKQLEHKYTGQEALSAGSISPDDFHIISPFGRLDEAAPRKTFFYLLATLNAAFPDYDFSDSRPDQFSKQASLDLVINSVNTSLFNLGNDFIVNRYRQVDKNAEVIDVLIEFSILLQLNSLWEVLDDLIELKDCDVYTYNPDPDNDPMNEDGYLWSMNYFFFNRRLKRMVFFSVKNQSMNTASDNEPEDEIFDDDDESGRHRYDYMVMGDMEEV